MKMKVLLIILMSIAILNMLDGVFTTYWIEDESAVESNPLMAELVNYPVIFMTVKITIVSLGLFLLWRLRNKRFITVFISSITLLIIFIGIFCYHIYGIFYVREMRNRRTVKNEHYYDRKCWIDKNPMVLTHQRKNYLIDFSLKD